MKGVGNKGIGIAPKGRGRGRGDDEPGHGCGHGRGQGHGLQLLSPGERSPQRPRKTRSASKGKLRNQCS